MSETLNVAEILRQKLGAALSPSHLDVVDESHLHAGHAGAREGGQSHFRLLIVCEQFVGLSRVARQRLVNAALRIELRDQVHALAMTTLTPDDYLAEKAS